MPKFSSVYTNCEKCKKGFLVQPHRFKSNRGRFCSVACRRAGIFTKETRLKMSNAKTGRPVPARQGERCHFWRGGVTDENKAIRMSMASRMWRKSVFERDKFTCQECGQVGGRLQADYIKPFCKYPEFRFDIFNGRTLCVSCHRKTPTYGRLALK